VPKRWEFGSQIHWLRFTPDHKTPRPWEPNGVLTGSGRDALKLVLQEKRWKRLWVPSYFCQDVVHALIQCPVEIVCYKDSPIDAVPDLNVVPFREGDAVLIVNYFGLRRQEDIVVPGPVGVIEDHTHGPCSRWAYESKADYCITSLRKIFPLPDGGTAWSPKGHALPPLMEATSELEAASAARLGAMLQKTLYLEGHSVDKRTFLELSTLGEERFESIGASGMTAFSRALLSVLPVTRWEQNRRNNFHRFAEALSLGKSFRILMPQDSQEAPFCVPFVFEDSELRNRVGARLIQQAIYPTTLWRLEGPLLEGVPQEHRELSRRMFILPCDARYSGKDVDRVIDAFREEGLLTDARGKEILSVPGAPAKKERFALRRTFTNAARTGFEHFLRHACPPGQRILLPAYVGRSSREGSGVLDPIEACGLPYDFYRVDVSLHADLSDLQVRLREAPVFAVLVIHYFGFPDPEIMEIRELCHKHGALLIEDCAHTLDSCFGQGNLGTIGDVSFFCIHKILPADDGGMLQINNSEIYVPPLEEGAACSEPALSAFCNADWRRISERRKSNYRELAGCVRTINKVTLMFPELEDGVTPQNLPVLIEHVDRFAVYRRMREEGIGVVALYDTLIEAIRPEEYPISHHLSRRILNLPVHQDVEPAQLDHIARTLVRAINE
jgi:dTDP-4-amino-4,6-dideoxygalactose transaminase